MKRNALLIKLLAAALALTALAGLAGAAGTAEDPLVSLSYLTGTYRDNLLADVDTAVAAQGRTLTAAFSEQVSAVTAALNAQPAQAAENDYETVALSAGQTVSVAAGGEVLLLSGAATVGGTGLTDATAGTAVAVGGALTANHLYVAAADCVVTAGGSVSLLVRN